MYSDTNVKFIKDNHKITCHRKVHDKTYIGITICHPNDYDFENDLTGEHYAYIRSFLMEMREKRDSIKSELKSLMHLYNILEQNINVSKKSIECYTIRRQIKLKERDLQEMRDLIKATQNNLQKTIKDKDDLYNAIRKKRTKHNS